MFNVKLHDGATGHHMMDWDSHSGMMNWNEGMMGDFSIFGVLAILLIVFLFAYVLRTKNGNISEYSNKNRDVSVYHGPHAEEVRTLKKIPPTSIYCTNCGKRIEGGQMKYCSQCGTAII